MSIILLTGRPRQGKGMVAAALAEEAMRQKRLVVADYWMDGALPLYAYTDISSPHFAGALFIFDEAGSTFAARDTFSLDPLVFAAATMHGHVGADVILQGQSVMFIDIQWRRLAAEVIVVTRVGPDGKNVISKVHSGEKRVFKGRVIDDPVPWFRRPWCHIARYYYITDFQLESGELKATAKPHRTRIFAWTRKRAKMYNTQQLMVPEHLSEAWKISVADSWHRRYEVPLMEKGKVLSPYQLRHVPPPVLVSRDGTPLKKQPDIESISDGRGYYTDGNDWHSNNLLTNGRAESNIKVVGDKLPINDSVEIVPYVPQKEGENGNGDGNGKSYGGANGNSAGTTLTRYTGRVRKPGTGTQKANSDIQSACGIAGKSESDSVRGDGPESSE